MKFSQLRQDLVSGDWIVVAPRRSRRPHGGVPKPERTRAPIETCPFEHPKGKPLLRIGSPTDWTVQVIRNKFPAFSHRETCPIIGTEGPYAVTDGVGRHEIVITRDHDADFPDLSSDAAAEVFAAFRDRYLMLRSDECLAYISIFHNFGPRAGASVYHPHYQIIAIPVVPPDVAHSLEGAHRYFARTHRCVHCDMIDWERAKAVRVVYENEYAIAFTPFVSRTSFEIRVFPKHHTPSFEETPEKDLAGVASALQQALKLMRSALHGPDYNFFIHTAPVRDGVNYQHYHWHIEVVPKTDTHAGFELGTGIDITSVDPDDAARMLRGKKR